MFEISGMSAGYGEAAVLHDVTVSVAAGEVATIVGRNGAGKSTLLRCAMGLHRQATGSVTLGGERIDRLSPDRRARAGLGWVPDDRGIYSTLSVLENLTLPPVVSSEGWSLEKIYEIFPALRDRRSSRGTQLSGGEQQMLAIARVLRSGARVLLLDEPSEGLAPVIVQRIGEVIQEVKRHGTAVLLVEQNVKFAATIADRHYLLAQGRVVEKLDNDEFQRREAELLQYLGI
jgi:branched-chain amino acid transport system ATP-binding protein